MAELNLLPKHLKEKRQQRVKIRNIIIFGLLGLSVFIYFLYIPFIQLLKVRVEEGKYKKQADAMNGKAIVENNEMLKKEIDMYKQYIDKVDYLTKSKIIVTDNLRELEPYVPKDVVFDSLAYSKIGITIDATAQKMDSISEFAANLQMSNNYKDVRISSITKVSENTTNSAGKESYKFTINAVK